MIFRLIAFLTLAPVFALAPAYGQYPRPCKTYLDRRNQRTIEPGEVNLKDRWAAYALEFREEEHQLVIDKVLDQQGSAAKGRIAIDIGAGSGRDGLRLLEAGYFVSFVDPSEGAMGMLRRDLEFLKLPPHRWQVHTNSLEDLMGAKLELPKADLISLAYVLGYTDQRRLPEFVQWLPTALREDGLVALDLFALDDYRVTGGRAFGVESSSVGPLLGKNFEFVSWLEFKEEDEGDHMHSFHVLLQKKPSH